MKLTDIIERIDEILILLSIIPLVVHLALMALCQPGKWRWTLRLTAIIGIAMFCVGSQLSLDPTLKCPLWKQVGVMKTYCLFSNQPYPDTWGQQLKRWLES